MYFIIKQNRMRRTKVTYLIEMAQKFDDRKVFAKIGESDDPKSRIKTLQTGNPFPLFIIGTTPKSESEMQNMFLKFNVEYGGTEWFIFERDFYENEVLIKFDPYEEFDLEVLNQLWRTTNNYKFRFYCIDGIKSSSYSKDKTKCTGKCCDAYMTNDEFFWLNYFFKFRTIVIDLDQECELFEKCWLSPTKFEDLDNIYDLYVLQHSPCLGPAINKFEFIRKANVFWFGDLKNRVLQYYRLLHSRTSVLKEPLGKYLIPLTKDWSFLNVRSSKSKENTIKKARIEALLLWFGVHSNDSETFWVIADTYLNRIRMEICKRTNFDTIDESENPNNNMNILMMKIYEELKKTGL